LCRSSRLIGYERRIREAPSLLLADFAEGVGLRYVGRAMDHPLAIELGLSDGTVDDLFVTASKL
jgi:hypothetical protein